MSNVKDIIDSLEAHCPDETSEFGEAITEAIKYLRRELGVKIDLTSGESVCTACESTVYEDDNFCHQCGNRLYSPTAQSSDIA